jgi:hypothetical protein
MLWKTKIFVENKKNKLEKYKFTRKYDNENFRFNPNLNPKLFFSKNITA